MHLLPIKINNSINYMVDFESNRKVEDSFVIAADVAGVMFSFCPDPVENGAVVMEKHQAKSFVFQTDRGKMELYAQQLVYNSEQNVLQVTLAENRNEQAVSDTQLGGLLSYEEDKLSINYVNINHPVNITVEFCYDNLSSKRVKFFLAPSSQIIDAVIDSGSEATQIAIYERGGDISINNLIPVVEDTFAHFNINEKEYIPNDFIQTEVEGNACNSRLLKTRFFVKNELNAKISADSVLPSGEDGPLLRMLVTPRELEKMRNDYIQLYNMKIASFGGVELPMIKVKGLKMPITKVGSNNFYYRKYMNVFLYEILTRACLNLDWEEDADNRKLLSLYVLMPNVYTPQKIQDCLDYIIKDLEKIIEGNDDFKNTILGFSVTAVSESDASLVGAISMSVGFQAGTYLIMDAGKGTLDFSVAALDEHGKLENKMKSGSIGASAAISYGFMLDLLQVYLDSRKIKIDNLQSFIYEKILGKSQEGQAVGGGDLYFLNLLMNAVDMYKIKYDGLEEDDSSISESIVDVAGDNIFDLQAFVEWIEKLRVKVPTPYVDRIVDTIIRYSIAKMATSLKREQTIDYVVFAGRGFLFNGLKTKMLEALKLKYTNIVEKTFLAPNDATTNKNVCMFITKAINEGLYNNQLLPEPRALNGTAIRAVSNIEITPIETDKERRVTTLQRLWNTIWDGETFEQNNSNAQIKGYVNEPFVLGYSVQCEPNQYYSIGGSFYHLPHYIVDGNADIFHSNGVIYIRYNAMGKVEVLTELPSLAVGLAFPSLFPYCDLTNSRDVFIPVINKQDSSSAETASTKTGTEDTVEENAEDAQASEGKVFVDSSDGDALLDKIKIQTEGNKN